MKSFTKCSKSENLLAQKGIFIVFFFFLLILPFIWLSIGNTGSLKLKPIHLTLGLVIIAVLATRQARRNLLLFPFDFSFFFTTYTVYLIMLFWSLLWASHGYSGATIVIKNSVYFSMSLFLSSLVSATNPKVIARSVYFAVPISIFIFVGISVWIFKSLDQNILAEYATAIISADSSKLHQGIYPILFNYMSGGIEQSKESGDFISASLRNNLMGAFILFLILSQMFKPALNSKKSNIVRYLALGCALFSAIVVLLSVSRSNILTLGFILFITGIVYFLRGQWASSSRRALMIPIAFLLIVIISIQIRGYLEGGVGAVATRLSELSQTQRFEMYNDALDKINTSPLLGYGVGAMLPGLDLSVHNLFLAAWFEGGVLAFFCSILFYFAIVSYWLQTIIRVITHPHTWHLPISVHWVIALPILPLFRAQVSGQGGNFTLIEWACLSFFLGYLALNRRYRAEALALGLTKYKPTNSLLYLKG